MPREWASSVVQMLEREAAVVRVVIAQVSGSAPREPGACMLVGREGVEGTIGGGRLEWESIAAARELLDDESAAARLNTVVLGADLGQCCGGVVAVWLERFTLEDTGLLRLVNEAGARGSAVLSSTVKGASLERRVIYPGCGGGEIVTDQAEVLLRKPPGNAHPRIVRDEAGGVRFLERLDDEFPAVWLYGAGHVGQALARILADLPLRLTWIDSRAELFPAVAPEGVRIRRDADALATVSDAPAGACFLVMTHSHPLDLALCRAILERNDFAWLGLIGSESKAARFRSRLKRAGVPSATVARLVCPIGIAGIESKWPAAIAVGVAAQVMQRVSAAAAARGGVGHARAVFGPPVRVESAGSPARAGATGEVRDCEGVSCSTCGTAAVIPSDELGAPGDSTGMQGGETAVQAGESDDPVVGSS